MSATEKVAPFPSRMQLAIEGAGRAVRALSVGDAAGVVSFDYDARWIASLSQLIGPADFADLDRRIGAIAPDGGTDIYRALELVYRGLIQQSAAVKHVILLTDGEQGSPAPFPTLVAAMRRADISISTIGIASQGAAAVTLESIARLGQGRHSIVHTATNLPDIFAREAYTFVSQVRGASPIPAKVARRRDRRAHAKSRPTSSRREPMTAFACAVRDASRSGDHPDLVPLANAARLKPARRVALRVRLHHSKFV